MSKNFKRRSWTRLSRLGKNRKNKQTWRRAKGRHNKVREKRKGYPIKVMLGFRGKRTERNMLENKKPVIVHNLRELEIIKAGEIAIIGKIGNKKRIEMLKKAKEKNIPVHNINVNKTLRKMEKQTNKPEEKKK
ncbi:50S ribosomal protein L32e [uncultured archaeon]|nr:50S ribosomal protein L32e [uncultured archaeon]